MITAWARKPTTKLSTTEWVQCVLDVRRNYYVASSNGASRIDPNYGRAVRNKCIDRKSDHLTFDFTNQSLLLSRTSINRLSDRWIGLIKWWGIACAIRNGPARVPSNHKNYINNNNVTAPLISRFSNVEWRKKNHISANGTPKIIISNCK